MRLLVVEDEPLVARAVVAALHRQGWAVDTATTLAEGRWLASEVDYDALVLDVHLPDGNGIDFCGELRAHGDTTPVLILTTQAAVADRIHGLDAGADDYLAKPFSAAELTARLRALARRVQPTTEAPLRVGDLVVDPASRTVTRDGHRIALAAREFAFVHLLARNPRTDRHPPSDLRRPLGLRRRTRRQHPRRSRPRRPRQTRPALHRRRPAHRPRDRLPPPGPRAPAPAASAIPATHRT